MFSPAFTTAKWTVAPSDPLARRQATEAPRPNVSAQPGSSTSTGSGWAPLAAAGALIAAAALRTSNRRRRHPAQNVFCGVRNTTTQIQGVDQASHVMKVKTRLARTGRRPPRLGNVHKQGARMFGAKGWLNRMKHQTMPPLEHIYNNGTMKEDTRSYLHKQQLKESYAAGYERYSPMFMKQYRKKELWMKYAKHMPGRIPTSFRLAKEAVMIAFKNQMREKRKRKGNLRRLTILRTGCNARMHGLPYNKLICRLKEANIWINRKIISQLGVYDRGVLTSIIELAVPDWRDHLAARYEKPKTYTHEEMDNAVIPYIEKTVPELYTDDTIRFNRTVKKWGIEYTVDMGPAEEWREILPKMPELANFELPDHMLGNANAEWEGRPIDLLDVPEGLESKHYLKFMQKVQKAQEEDKEKEAKGEPVWPKKEGVSREDWFKEEQQSWF
eukprot:TRINITY_DN17323_c2_g1_i1.p1 TRINITY_DN17323_c2_g1~~TRINITY_DN17323_c2_g1_i1.p1  ORF type:complete len:501 (+),score=78.58 TRINITY_DN17323_c2_g1_i1:179-1504(+)